MAAAASETRLVCGYLESSEFLFAPVFRTLPELLVEQTGEGRIGELIASTVREIIALVDAATPGSQLMLGRLMEMLFVEVLRRHIARLPSGSDGLVRGDQRSDRRPRACSSSTPIPASAGPPRAWRARRARRAPFSPSDSTRCSAGRRSTM